MKGMKAPVGKLRVGPAGAFVSRICECRVGNMGVLVLAGLLVLVIGGCVCVVWASRGGPRWVRGVAMVTLTVGELLRISAKKQRRSVDQTGGDGD